MIVRASIHNKLPIDIGVNLRQVERPPTWRDEPYTLSYLLTDRDVEAAELIALLRWALASQLPNPRVITPELIQWSSLFHPRFFRSIHSSGLASVRPLVWLDSHLPLELNALSRLWLQSVLFLSGVTLSAAIIQQRFSSGTIGSKLDRLWDAGSLATEGVAPELLPLNLHDRVRALANERLDAVNRLLAIRDIFMRVLRLIAPTTGKIEIMRQSAQPTYADGRFGFVNELHAKLGGGLRAVVVYGSSVASDQFADIDALVVVDDPQAALLRLAGTKPIWLGKELNLGVYSPDELITLQYLSGDNLADYGLCIWGETEVVQKPVPELLARNFSFGVVRQRQQLGMLSRAAAETDAQDADRRNLYEYFVKIPANVAKGTFGAIGERWPKERVHDWLLAKLGFDTPAAQKRAVNDDALGALAASALATGRTLSALNTAIGVVRIADQIDNQEGVQRDGSDSNSKLGRNRLPAGSLQGP